MGCHRVVLIAIAQDKKGFLWLGTQDGLNRYDGHQFKIFKNIPFDSTSLAENYISALLIDSKDRLWVGTRNKGLHLFHPKNNTFTRFQYSTTTKNTISHDAITCLYEDNYHNIWVGTKNGLNQVQFTKKGIQFKYYQHQPNLPRTYPAKQSITSIYHDSKGNLWVGSFKGLHQYIFKGKDIVHQATFLHKKGNKNSLSEDIVISIVEDKLGRTWVGTHNGLNVLEDGQFHIVNLMEENRS